MADVAGIGPDVDIRELRRAELDLVLKWAAAEGWNPGVGDAEAFWAADPHGYVGFDVEGELAGAGSIVAYGREAGFMGLFIVRPELRHRGLGGRLWTHRRDTLLARLRRGASIGLDGVIGMVDFYRRGGFRTSHRTLRMHSLGRDPAPAADPDLVRLVDLPRAEVAAVDLRCFGVARPAFLERWIDPPGGLGVGLRGPSGVRGVGVIRPAAGGFRIGPLFSEDLEAAARLFAGLAAMATGRPVFLDVPERNAAALQLADQLGLDETFRCERMYLGEPPPIAWDRVYGVTTLELG